MVFIVVSIRGVTGDGSPFNHPTRHEMLPTAKNYPAKSVNSAKTGKPYFPFRYYYVLLLS